MEIPFKYIVLSIIKTLNERNMPLVISRDVLVQYINIVVDNLFYTLSEKKELYNNFNFQYELDDLLDKYYEYFENDNNEIIFDNDYIEKLDSLIADETDDNDIEVINDVDYAIEGNTSLLDVLGIKINKKLYEFFLDIEKNIEECYDDLYAVESNMFEISKDKKQICNNLRMLHMKKIIMLINSKNLLSKFEFEDIKNYSNNIVDRIIDEDDVKLLYESESFNVSDIVGDVYLKSIFTSDDSYICNLDETLNVNYSNDNDKYNKIKFYMMFIDLLDEEINNYSGLLKSELIKVKYRIMNTLDSVCSTATFVCNCNNLDDKHEYNFDFMSESVYYFINELLMYDDEKYKNKVSDADNIMIYLDNIIKKLLIETYYTLTRDNIVIKQIKDNKLYGINNISSGFLKNIVEKSKVKVKEV